MSVFAKKWQNLLKVKHHRAQVMPMPQIGI